MMPPPVLPAPAAVPSAPPDPGSPANADRDSAQGSAKFDDLLALLAGTGPAPASGPAPWSPPGTAARSCGPDGDTDVRPAGDGPPLGSLEAMVAALAQQLCGVSPTVAQATPAAAAPPSVSAAADRALTAPNPASNGPVPWAAAPTAAVPAGAGPGKPAPISVASTEDPDALVAAVPAAGTTADQPSAGKSAVPDPGGVPTASLPTGSAQPSAVPTAEVPDDAGPTADLSTTAVPRADHFRVDPPKTPGPKADERIPGPARAGRHHKVAATVPAADAETPGVPGAGASELPSDASGATSPEPAPRFDSGDHAANGEVEPSALSAPRSAGIGATTGAEAANSSSDPAPAATPAGVADQIVSAVVPLHGRGGGRHEVMLELRPEGLGAIRVELSVEHQTVHLTLHATEPATAALLDRALPDLRSALADAGLHAGQVGVEPGGGGGAGQRRHPDDEAASAPGGNRRRARGAAATAVAGAGPRSATAHAAGRLDVLL